MITFKIFLFFPVINNIMNILIIFSYFNKFKYEKIHNATT